MTSSRKSLLQNTTMLTIGAMVIGAILGLVFGPKMQAFKIIGDLWLNALKMVIVPLVLCIMILAVGGQKDVKTLGKTAVRILCYYVITTIFACIIGIVVASVLKPGAGAVLEGLQGQDVGEAAKFSIQTFFSSLVSSNMIKSFADGNVIQTMVIAILLGMAVLNMKDQDRKQTVLHWFESINDMITTYIGFIIKLTPVGVCFLIADTFGSYGMAIFGSMLRFIATYWIAVLVQIILVYCVFLWVTAKISPYKFLKESSPVWLFTLATCSSAANIPISVECSTKRFKVPKHIADFCIPLGAQLNYDGMGILFGCVIIFMSQMYNMPMDVGTLVKLVVVGTIISSSGGGIPGSGLVKLLLVVETFAFPVELVGIIAGFYRFIDMPCTTGNCLGDLAGTVFVSKWEEKDLQKQMVKS